MKKRYAASVVLASVLLPANAALASVAGYKRCIEEKRAAIEQPKEVEAYRDNGCTTKATSLDGTRHRCDQNVCWNAPPGHLIVLANIWNSSAAGTEHQYGATQYLPSREFATSICNSVYALSGSGPASGRGWQKLSANVTIVRKMTDSERAGIEAECERIN